MHRFENLNQTLIGMSQNLLDHGIWKTVRGLKCCEIPYPVIIEIQNPTDRYITIPKRKWNKYLPFAESLWIALGLNDIRILPSKYCKGLEKYSDNGQYWRAGYGPRLRSYTGLGTDPAISNPKHRRIWSGFIRDIDQLEYVILALQRDINTRQAIIEIGDPVKDDFSYNLAGGHELKSTVDYPCTRSIQFMMSNNKLNCIVHMRSNDLLYGLSAVNIFNFTLMQEYIANILNVPVGMYYHIANNLHMYADQQEIIKELAMLDFNDYRTDEKFVYTHPIEHLAKFDDLCLQLFNYEQLVSRGECEELITFGNDMFDDWGKVFLHHKYKEMSIVFKNPYLNKLFYGIS